MAYKKTFKERFESVALYTALTVPVAGALGGAWFGATSSVAAGTAGAVLLGTGGAAAGLVLGAAVGAAGFVAAHAIYKNKEYIALAVMGMAVLPFALAARGLKGMRRAAAARLQKMRPKIRPSSDGNTVPAAAPEKPAAAKNTARSLGGWLKKRFQNKSAGKAEKDASAAPKNPAPKNPSPPAPG